MRTFHIVIQSGIGPVTYRELTISAWCVGTAMRRVLGEYRNAEGRLVKEFRMRKDEGLMIGVVRCK